MSEVDYWLVKYGDWGLLMTDEEFMEFADCVKYEGVEYEAQRVKRVREYYDALPEAR